MIELIAGLIGALFGLFWLAVHLAGWLIVALIVLAPLAWLASKFVAPPD